MVDDGEAVVGGPREHRQQVHVADDVADVVAQERRQRVQRRLAGPPDPVAVGDQAGGALGGRLDARPRKPRRVALGQGDQLRGDLGVPLGVEQLRRAARSARRAPSLADVTTRLGQRQRGRRPRPRPGRTGRRCRRRPAGRAPWPAPTRRARRPGRRTTAARRTGGGLRPLLALGVRRTRHHAVGVVDPEPALLPGPRGQRHQPAQPAGAVLAALVEGVGRDPHRVDQPDAGQERRAAADQVDVGSDRLADQRQPDAVRRDRVDVVVPAARDGAGVEEVELEVVDAQVDQPLQVASEQVADAGVGQVEARQLLAPVAAGRPDQPVGVLAGQRRVRADQERGQPDAGPAAGGADRVDDGGQRPEPLGLGQPLAQAGAPAVVDLDDVDGAGRAGRRPRRFSTTSSAVTPRSSGTRSTRHGAAARAAAVARRQLVAVRRQRGLAAVGVRDVDDGPSDADDQAVARQLARRVGTLGCGRCRSRRAGSPVPGSTTRSPSP